MSRFRFNRIVLGISFLSLPFHGGTVHAQTNQISLEAYQQLVEETQGVVVSLRPTAGENAAVELAPIAQQWENIQEVLLPDGQIIPIDTAYLVALLQSVPPDLDLIETQLNGLATLSETWPEKVYGADEVASVKEILRQPEYQWPEQKPSPLQSVLDKINDWIGKLFNSGQKDQAQSAPLVIDLRWLYSLVSFLFIGGILYFVLRDTIGALVSETDLESDQDGNQILTSDGAFSQAQLFSEQGDHRTAVRYLYLSALLVLEEKGILYYDRSKTNTEYVESVSNHPNLMDSLKKVVGVFDRVWYGFRSLDDRTFSEYQKEVERLRDQR